jgi:hypothetical protein
VGGETFAFSAQKTMYGGKHIAQGDTIFVFASENESGPGLIASGGVTSADWEVIELAPVAPLQSATSWLHFP